MVFKMPGSHPHLQVGHVVWETIHGGYSSGRGLGGIARVGRVLQVRGVPESRGQSQQRWEHGSRGGDLLGEAGSGVGPSSAVVQSREPGTVGCRVLESCALCKVGGAS